MMRCTYAAGLSSVGEFYCNRNANRFESWPAVPGGHSDRISGQGDVASGARPVYAGACQQVQAGGGAGRLLPLFRVYRADSEVF